MQKHRVKGREIAIACGVRESTVSGWRSGSYAPDREKWAALADVLRTSIDFLFLGRTEEKIQPGKSGIGQQPTGEITRADVISYVNELLDVVEDRPGMISFVYWKLRRDMPIDEYRDEEVDHDAVQDALEDKKRAEARKRDFRSGGGPKDAMAD